LVTSELAEQLYQGLYQNMATSAFDVFSAWNLREKALKIFLLNGTECSVYCHSM